MKVVLFCGGLGTRLREHSETIPKPLVNVGYRPIIWHLMRYYAHFGHKEFILCLGYRGDMVREYFLHYKECMTNDFTISEGGRRIELHGSDIDDWRITFVETGLHSNIGQRLLRVKRYIGDDAAFLANYADGLSDVPLDRMIGEFERQQFIASFVAVHPTQSFHVVDVDTNGFVNAIGPMGASGALINGGFFVLRQSVFDFLSEGEELVEAPFNRIARIGRLGAYRHEGFWMPMDTFKDKITLDRMEARGNCPWKLWDEAKGRCDP